MSRHLNEGGCIIATQRSAADRWPARIPGQAWVRSHFAMAQVAARYVEFYGQVLGQRRPR